MPIEKAISKNYQSHEDTSLEFSERMNVLFGESDHGKSAFIRGMKWTIRNRPNGERFRRHDTDQSSVLIKTHTSTVKRIRSDSKNEYRIKGKKDPFKALRMEVPEDVSLALNLDDTNIQSQDEVWFLIDKSPGQVSKSLNKVAGLEMTDKVIKQVNSDVRETTAERNSTNKSLISTRQKIMDLEWVKKANKFLTKLEGLQDKLNSSIEKFQSLEFTIFELNKLIIKKNKFISEKAIRFMDKIFSLKDKLNTEEEKFDRLNSVVSDIKEQKILLSDIDIIDVSELEKLSVLIESEQDRRNTISDCLMFLKVNKSLLKDVSAKVILAEKNYRDELKRLGTCPTCNAKT